MERDPQNTQPQAPGPLCERPTEPALCCGTPESWGTPFPWEPQPHPPPVCVTMVACMEMVSVA